jgi:ATP-binding cassette subfamily B protein
MPSESKERRATQVWAVLHDYARAALKYPWLLLLILVGGIAIEAASVAGSLVLKHLVDQLAGAPSPERIGTVYATLGLFVAVMFGGWFGQRFRQIGLSSIEPKVMADLSDKAFSYLIGHSHDFFVSNFAGTLTRRVTRYARAFESVLDTISFNFTSALIYVTSILVVLTLRNIYVGLAVLVWTVFFITVQILMARWRQPLRVARSAEDSKMTGVISDAIGNHSAISLFATSEHERDLFMQSVDAWKLATFRSWNADNWIWAIQGIFVTLFEGALLAAAVYFWGQGVFSVGDFVLIQLYILGIIDRVWNIGNAMRHLYDSFADAYEMVVIFETPHEVADMPTATPLAVTVGAIEFKDVLFNFNQTREILKHYDLAIKGGEKVAFVGPSGAGKSTITKLLLRLYDVTGGHIYVDGQDIAHATQASLRTGISFVPQEPVLFHRTLKENIRYGRLDATDEEVIEAARKAHCHEFIAQLPDGYDTFVGERGVKLSGGERQRVAIARAILKNAPILVLDEATSSLDSESEHLIQEALDTLMEGKTVIVVAHRLSTIMKMDRIVVMENGAIAAQGTHTELLAQDGLYKKLWSIQAGGFLGGEQAEPAD